MTDKSLSERARLEADMLSVRDFPATATLLRALAQENDELREKVKLFETHKVFDERDELRAENERLKEDAKDNEDWHTFLPKACKLGIHPMVWFHRSELLWHCHCGKETMKPQTEDPRVPIPEDF